METIKLLQQLIQIPSPSGQEKTLAGFILNYCRKNNIFAQNQDGNIVIRIRGRKPKKALIFNAHLDTVSAGNRKLWKYPPYGKQSGKIIGGKIYGLGASDDKAAIASMLLLAKSVVDPDFDIWITFVVNEEINGAGTASFLKWFQESKNLSKYTKIAAVIGEPTNLNSIEIGHRGNAFVKLATGGTTGHGAGSYKKYELAVGKMLEALDKLEKAFALWKKMYHDKILGEPTLNITGLQTTGGSANKIPDQCFATLDIRTTPSLHPKLDKLLKDTLGGEVTIERIKGNDKPGLTAENSNICRLCRKLFPKLPFTISPRSNDFSQFLEAGIETIILGPGDKILAHKENEYAEVSKIDKAVAMYKKIIGEVFQ